MNKNLKLILAVLAGFIFCAVLNFVFKAVLTMLRPALGEVGRAAQETNDFS